jgi:hypothetical protein
MPRSICMMPRAHAASDARAHLEARQRNRDICAALHIHQCALRFRLCSARARAHCHSFIVCTCAHVHAGTRTSAHRGRRRLGTRRLLCPALALADVPHEQRVEVVVLERRARGGGSAAPNRLLCAAPTQAGENVRSHAHPRAGALVGTARTCMLSAATASQCSRFFITVGFFAGTGAPAPLVGAAVPFPRCAGSGAFGSQSSTRGSCPSSVILPFTTPGWTPILSSLKYSPYTG